MEQDVVEVNNLAKKERRQYPAILTSHLVTAYWMVQKCLNIGIAYETYLLDSLEDGLELGI